MGHAAGTEGDSAPDGVDSPIISQRNGKKAPKEIKPKLAGRLAILSGLMLWLAHPGIGCWWLAWFALVPVIWSVTEAPSLLRALWQGYLFGFVFLGAVWYWIGLTISAFTHSWLAPLGWFAVTAILATSFGAWGGLVWVACRRLSRGNAGRPQGGLAILTVASAWVVIEFLRSCGDLATPWASLSYSQYRFLPILQIADLGGGYLLSFLILLSNAAIWYELRHWKETHGRGHIRRPMFWVVFLMVLALGYGTVRILATETGRSVPVAAVQTGFNCLQSDFNSAPYPGTSAQYDALRRLTSTAMRGPLRPVLCVWPEGAVPGDAVNDPKVRQFVEELATAYDSAIVTGSSGHSEVVRQLSTGRIITNPQERRHIPFADMERVDVSKNMSVLFAPQAITTAARKGHPGELPLYVKRQRVPFGEFVPFRSLMPRSLLEQFSYLTVDDFAGDTATPLRYVDPYYGNIVVGPFICFESLFPGCAREMANAGANMLVTQSNDSWFPSPVALEQHLSAVVLRAVENRRAIVRSTMTGITCFVDANGRIYGELPLKSDDVRVERIHLHEEKTFYTLYGDWFVALCAVILGWVFVATQRRWGGRSHGQVVALCCVCVIFANTVSGCRSADTGSKRVISDRLNTTTVRAIIERMQRERAGAVGEFRLEKVLSVGFVAPDTIHVEGERTVYTLYKGGPVRASYDLACGVEQGILRVRVTKTTLPGVNLSNGAKKLEISHFEEAMSRALTTDAMDGTADAGVRAVGVEGDSLIIEAESPYR